MRPLFLLETRALNFKSANHLQNICFLIRIYARDRYKHKVYVKEVLS